MFLVEREYNKSDIYNLLDVPIKNRKGSSDTGYRSYSGAIFIFANIGVAGRTGVNHGNYWENDHLVWFGKSKSHPEQKLIKIMLSNEVDVHIFTRNDSKKAFTYKGVGQTIAYERNKPIKIVWSLIDSNKKPSEQKKSIDGLDEIYTYFKEGISKKAEVNLYKRSLEARRKCIEQKGCICSVCKFDFKKTYGNIGYNFIHIHHLKELSEIKEEYLVDPKEDLVPVCPNCHAMLHKRKPAYTIEELKKYWT